jgi:hypothetical protein
VSGWGAQTEVYATILIYAGANITILLSVQTGFDEDFLPDMQNRKR